MIPTGDRIELPNGTCILRGPDWCDTRLPNGRLVPARIEERTARIAENMGTTPALLTRNHDMIHSALLAWLGAPYSYSLMQSAGEPVDPVLASLEEAAVLAVQRLHIALSRHSTP